MKSHLQVGNRALREGDFVTAIQKYMHVLAESPALGRFMAYNIGMAQQGLHGQRSSNVRRRVAVCGWDLARSASRAHTLCLLHERAAHVELIGCSRPGAGADIWPPLQGSRFALHFVAGEGVGFIERALRLVVEHPFDLVHLAQPRAHNLVIGLLYQLVWGARILVDIDDDELARIEDSTDGQQGSPARWPAAQALADADWTRIAVGMVGHLDGITVSNPALRARYGGSLLHHARDEGRYAPSDELRSAGRRRLQLGAAAKVVLLCATQRNPAVLMELGRAVAALDLEEAVLVVAGAASDHQMASELRALQGVEARLLGDVPFDLMPELMAAADVHVVLQDFRGGPGGQRLPASVVEALLMGLPVVARLAPELLVEPLRQSVIDAAATPLTAALHQALSGSPPATRRLEAQATGLTQLLGLAHNASALEALCGVGDGPRRAMDPECVAVLEALDPPRWLHALMVLREPVPGEASRVADPPASLEGAPVGSAPASTVPPLEQSTSVDSTPPPRRDPHWTPCDAMLPWADVAVVELLGQSLCLLPRESRQAAEPDLQLLRAFASMHGRADASAVRLRSEGLVPPDKVGLPAGGGPLEWPARCSHWQLTRAGLVLVDVWHSDDHTLRLRVESSGSEQPLAAVLRAFQVQPGQEALCIGAEALVGINGADFVDVSLVNPYWPLLLVLTVPDGRLLDMTLLPFPSLFRGGAHHGEVSAVGRMPAGMDNLEDLSNSLAAELAGWAEGPVSFSVGSLHVDLCGATGAERLFSPLVHEWLLEVMQLSSLRPATGAVDSGVPDTVLEHLKDVCEIRVPVGVSEETRRRALERAEEGGLVLTVSADSLPTISALVSRRLTLGPHQAVMSGAWVVVHPATGKPRTLVSLPPLTESLMDLQPLGMPQGFPLLRRRQRVLAVRGEPSSPSAGDDRAPFPLALRFRDAELEPQTVLLQPLASDRGRRVLRRALSDAQRQSASITALLHLGAGAALEEPMLESLARQTLASAVEVVVALAPARAAEHHRVAALLRRLFPGRAQVMCLDTSTLSEGINAAAARASGRHLMLVAPGALLHDPRTLEVLHTMVQEPGVATAACVMLREVALKKGAEVRFFSGGVFPRRLSFDSLPALLLDEPSTSDAFPLATYPVVGNSFRLALVDVVTWRELGGLDAQRFPGERADIDFCLRALQTGRSHLCTAAVSATLLRASGAAEHADTHSPSLLPMQRWHDVLKSVALIRDLEA